jgi:hypothetical protein
LSQENAGDPLGVGGGFSAAATFVWGLRRGASSQTIAPIEDASDGHEGGSIQAGLLSQPPECGERKFRCRDLYYYAYVCMYVYVWLYVCVPLEES